MKTNNLLRYFLLHRSVACCNFCPGLRFFGQLPLPLPLPLPLHQSLLASTPAEQAMHIKTSSVPHKCQHVSKLPTRPSQSTHHNNNKSPTPATYISTHIHTYIHTYICMYIQQQRKQQTTATPTEASKHLGGQSNYSQHSTQRKRHIEICTDLPFCFNYFFFF